jgi:organic hydroperoxide reductase OsmC/OhrA
MDEKPIVTTLELQKGYQFLARFDQPDVPPLLLDEPPPLGQGAGPSPSRLLSAAIGNCLSASALFCLKKARIQVDGMRTTVETLLVRKEQNRWRVGEVKVRITIEIPPEDRPRAGRCLAMFEDFCVVTQSVRNGIAVDMSVDVPETVVQNAG